MANNYVPFVDDEEKMYDFYRLSKNEFLKSYSYLTEEEYDLTANAVSVMLTSLASAGKTLFLEDLETGVIDAAIVSSSSDKDDVQNAIDKAKSDKPEDYTWEDIFEALPNGCVTFPVINKLYY